jgi:uncharacterized protein DUF559/putative AbiEi antitoxin of type IV toxin-antitoxin system
VGLLAGRQHGVVAYEQLVTLGNSPSAIDRLVRTGWLHRIHPGEYRLPQPQINVTVCGYVVDFLWEDRKLIVEADCYEFHRDRATFESDRKRDIQLRLHGYTVIRLTHRRLKEEPAVVAKELQALLSAW